MSENDPQPIPFHLNRVVLNDRGERVLARGSGPEENVRNVPIRLWKPKTDSQGREIVVLSGGSGTEQKIASEVSGGLCRIDLAQGGLIFEATIDSETEIEFVGASQPVGTVRTFELHLVMEAAVPVTWPEEITWLEEDTNLSAGKTNVFVFRTKEETGFIGNKSYEA